MYGVVLWSDSQDHKAVIWCEDHGDLAYYRKAADDGPVRLDPGDWVEFEVVIDRHLRLAQDPRRVSDEMLPELVETLAGMRPQRRQPDPGGAAAREAAARGSAEIIPFAMTRRTSPFPSRHSMLRQA
jgi:hypothetical protein